MFTDRLVSDGELRDELAVIGLVKGLTTQIQIHFHIAVVRLYPVSNNDRLNIILFHYLQL